MTDVKNTQAFDDILFALKELDTDTVTILKDNPGIVSELKTDRYCMKMVGDAVMIALGSDENYAEQLRQVFGLDMLSIINGDPTVGRAWLNVVIRGMIQKSPEKFAEFKRTWGITDFSVKFYALEYLASNKHEQAKDIIMKQAGISQEDITGHQEGKRNNPIVHRVDNTQMAARVIMASLEEA